MCVPVEVEANVGSSVPTRAEIEESLRRTVSNGIAVHLTPWE